MGETTNIAWTDATFNLVIGCAKVSEACKFCYAESFAKRIGLKVWGDNAPRKTLSDAYWKQPYKWNAEAAKAGERRRVFCSSLADVFEDHPTVAEQRLRLWPLIAGTPNLDWLLLTKRPENITKFAPLEWRGEWPRNVWMGTTVENQARHDERWPVLAAVPAAVRFLSCEPLLEEVRLRCSLCAKSVEDHSNLSADFNASGCPGHFPDWVIVGGESGHGARPFAMQWALELIRDCKLAKTTAVFVKQMGAKVYRECDGEGPIGPRILLSDKKGGDPVEWPWQTLNVRQFPEVSR